MRLGPGKHLQGRILVGGIVKPDEFDYFHEARTLLLDAFSVLILYIQAIIHMELARVSSRAVVDGLLAGLVIGLPPVLNYGSLELRRTVVPDVGIFIRVFR